MRSGGCRGAAKQSPDAERVVVVIVAPSCRALQDSWLGGAAGAGEGAGDASGGSSKKKGGAGGQPGQGKVARK